MGIRLVILNILLTSEAGSTLFVTTSLKYTFRFVSNIFSSASVMTNNLTIQSASTLWSMSSNSCRILASCAGASSCLNTYSSLSSCRTLSQVESPIQTTYIIHVPLIMMLSIQISLPGGRTMPNWSRMVYEGIMRITFGKDFARQASYQHKLVEYSVLWISSEFMVFRWGLYTMRSMYFSQKFLGLANMSYPWLEAVVWGVSPRYTGNRIFLATIELISPFTKPIQPRIRSLRYRFTGFGKVPLKQYASIATFFLDILHKENRYEDPSKDSWILAFFLIMLALFFSYNCLPQFQKSSLIWQQNMLLNQLLLFGFCFAESFYIIFKSLAQCYSVLCV